MQPPGAILAITAHLRGCGASLAVGGQGHKKLPGCQPLPANWKLLIAHWEEIKSHGLHFLRNLEAAAEVQIRRGRNALCAYYILHMYCGTLEVTGRHPAPPDCWEEDYHTGAERGNLLQGREQKNILLFFKGGVKRQLFPLIIGEMAFPRAPVLLIR